MKNLLTATILHSDSDTERITIACRKDEDGGYRWYCPANDDPQGRATEDTEVSANTLAKAKQAAIDSWGSPAWKMRARWLR